MRFSGRVQKRGESLIIGVKAIPFILFRLASNAFPDIGLFGRSEKGKKKTQVVSESEAWYPSIIAVEPGKHKT